jgi:hypothetical protein
MFTTFVVAMYCFGAKDAVFTTDLDMLQDKQMLAMRLNIIG